MFAYAVRPLGVYLRLSTYRIVPMKVEVRRFLPDLKQILTQGVLARRDENRIGFYEIEANGSCFYIHVYHAAQTVYLLARFSSEPVAYLPAESMLDMLQSVAMPA